MTALRDLTGQYLELLDLAKSDDAPQEAIRDTLDAIEGEFNDKAIKVVDVISAVGNDIAAIDREIERLQARKKVILNKEKNMRDYLISNMEVCGIKKIQCPLFSITFVEGKEAVIVDNEDLLPDEFIKVKTSTAPDKVALKAALKSGEIPGAHLGKGSPYILIK